MSRMNNRVDQTGNLTADVEMRYMPNGDPVANLRLAVNHVFKDKEGEKHESADFFSWVAYGRLAEVLNEYAKKGSKVRLIGYARNETWVDKDTQEKRYATKFIVGELSLLDKKEGESGPQGADESDGQYHV